jgi:hypothetical protein
MLYQCQLYGDTVRTDISSWTLVMVGLGSPDALLALVCPYAHIVKSIGPVAVIVMYVVENMRSSMRETECSDLSYGTKTVSGGARMHRSLPHGNIMAM